MLYLANLMVIEKKNNYSLDNYLVILILKSWSREVYFPTAYSTSASRLSGCTFFYNYHILQEGLILNKKEDQKQTSALTIEDLFVLIYTLQLFPFL